MLIIIRNRNEIYIMYILPLIRSQNTNFDEQENVCHSTAYTIHSRRNY